MGRIAFEDVKFQLYMTHIEYVDLSRRDIASNPVSDFDYFDEVQGPYKKQKTQYIGQDMQARMMSKF